MNKKEIGKLLAQVKANSSKRKFVQGYDLVVSLKSLDLKKNDQQVDFYTNLSHSRGKKVKVCAIVGPELIDEGKRVCDECITVTDLPKYKADPKLAKKLAETYDFFVAQANVMGQLAGTFGKIFGPRGKMPNPKAGCVVPPKTNLQPLYDRLQNTVRIMAKTGMMFQVPVGNEKMNDEEVIDNIYTVYDQMIHHLPNEKNNVKAIYLKTTMGKPAKFGEGADKKGKK